MGKLAAVVVVLVSIAGATTPAAAQVSPAPFGQVDTPAQGVVGLQGTVAVTGWALDAIGVRGVKIYRDCLPMDAAASCQMIEDHALVFIGDAAFAAGARPDVEAAFHEFPQSDRAGWGYLLLTNMLPDVSRGRVFGGQGRLTLYAYASALDGAATFLGRSPVDHTPTTITMANDSIAKPFGAIDTPLQGATVSGYIMNFGWALTPDDNEVPDSDDYVIPPDGSTIVVFIDGVPTSTVMYDQCRGTGGSALPPETFCDDDVAGIFGNPEPKFAPRHANPTRYRNLDAGHGAIVIYPIDTTTLSNGLHSIAWSVTDRAGRVEGIGSRFFTVLNGEADPRRAGELANAPAVRRGPASSVAALPVASATVRARTGFDLAALRRWVRPDAEGRHRVEVPALGRLELSFGPWGVSEGALIVDDARRDLPPGSHLDVQTGVFTWTPTLGYFGTYHFTFVRGTEQMPVDVTVR